MVKNILHLGDASAYCDFGSEVNEQVNSRVISYFIKIKELQKQKKIEGIINLTPSYNKLIISFDLDKTNFNEVKGIVKNLEIDKQNKNLCMEFTLEPGSLFIMAGESQKHWTHQIDKETRIHLFKNYPEFTGIEFRTNNGHRTTHLGGTNCNIGHLRTPYINTNDGIEKIIQY